MHDINVVFEYIAGENNKVADLLSWWHSAVNPVGKLFAYLNKIPVWTKVPSTNLLLDWNI
jgi:hypothetical protein